MFELDFRKPLFTLALIAILPLLPQPGECRSEVRIHALPRSSVERVSYLGKGSFEVTLKSVNSTSSGKPPPFFDGKYKLTFVIHADSLDGTLIEKSGTDDMRTDFKLDGPAFVNLLISKTMTRAELALSCALLPADKDPVRGTYQLMYFQVDGT